MSSSSSSSLRPMTAANNAVAGPSSSAAQDRYLPLQTFSSPNSTPLPAHTHALLESKRQSLFTGSSNRTAASTHAPSRSRYAVADSGRLSGNRARPHHRSSDPASLSSPDRSLAAGAAAGAVALDQDSPTRQVWRAKFRQRCQQQMARDRARTLAHTRGASFLRHMGAEPDDELVLTPGHADPSSRFRRADMIGSDDLPSSSDVDADMDEGGPAAGGSRWWEDDEELIRRVMVAEYRRIKRAQEASGEREVGWLDPDEVAYLEEETRREESDLQTASTYAGAQRRPLPADATPTKNIGPTWTPGVGMTMARRGDGAAGADVTPRAEAAELEPPEDLLDDDEALYNHYLHHHTPQLSTTGGAGGDEAMDQGDNDDDDGEASQPMSQSWEGDQDFEMALASMPMPHD
ncbi:uncharacterized protein PSFLO_01063 [Pseudozyma flocculosa]|nr:uncharacterized protein PSFLO_01063 [Pseudozyma flocculosa]